MTQCKTESEPGQRVGPTCADITIWLELIILQSEYMSTKQRIFFFKQLTFPASLGHSRMLIFEKKGHVHKIKSYWHGLLSFFF